MHVCEKMNNGGDVCLCSVQRRSVTVARMKGHGVEVMWCEGITAVCALERLPAGEVFLYARLSDYLNVSYRHELKTARQPHKVVLLFRTPGGT